MKGKEIVKKCYAEVFSGLLTRGRCIVLNVLINRQMMGVDSRRIFRQIPGV